MIRWIIDGVLGTAAFSSINSQDRACIIDVRDLVDKPGNTQVSVKKKIDRALEAMGHGERVVICCDYGISRSNAVAAGVLAKAKNIPFEQALRKVVQTTGEKHIKVEMTHIVRSAIEDDSTKGPILKRKSKILVTGGNGYLGKSLLNRTSGKFDLETSDTLNLLEDTVGLDEYVRQNNISTLVHFASPRIWNTNKALGETLVILRNVLDVCRENDIKLILPSHKDIFSGYRTEKLIATEDTPPKPKGLYGETKFFSELLVRQYHEEYGLQFLIVRAPSVYGANTQKPHFIQQAIRKAHNNQDITTHTYSNGAPTLELLHVDDYISAMEQIIKKDISGILHLGSEELKTTKEIAEEICTQLKSKAKTLAMEIDDFTPNIKMNYSRALEDLNWRPLVGLQKGLQNLISLHRIQEN